MIIYDELYEKIKDIISKNSILKQKVKGILSYDDIMDYEDVIGYIINHSKHLKSLDVKYLYVFIDSKLNSLYTNTKSSKEIDENIKKYYNFLSRKFKIQDSVIDLFIYTMDKSTIKKLNLCAFKNSLGFVHTEKIKPYYKAFCKYLNLDIEPNKENIKNYLNNIYFDEKWNKVDIKIYKLKDFDKINEE